MTRRLHGVTLIELLVAMSIFSVLGLFLFVLMRGSLDIYRSSRSSGELYDKFAQVVTPIADDLSCVSIGDPEGQGPKVRFVFTHDRKYVPPEGVTLQADQKRARTYTPGDPRSFLLRFVRTFPGSEMETTVGRFAGTYADASAYIDGVDDLAESRAERLLTRKKGQPEKDDDAPPGLRAPGNLMEVMYFLDAGEWDLPGTYTLYRAVRSPIGGPGSFFSNATLAAMSPEWIQANAKPVVTGIAYLGMVLWSQNTTAWETERVLAGDGVAAGKNNEWSELWWDSARSDVAQFSLNRGSSSRGFWRDDVFPRRARLVVTLVEEGRTDAAATLVAPLKGKERTIRISTTEPFEDFEKGGARFLRIGDEWMEVKKVGGRTLTVVRGARETAPQRHENGAVIVVGRTFEKTIEIPSYRSYFRGPGEGR